MKGYIINNRCYVFPQEVGELPSIEAEVIYVQEEDIKAWKEANGAVADKIKKYNYNVITVNPKEWSGHKDDELTPPQTFHNIAKESYAGSEGVADLISIDKQSATTGETITIRLTQPEEYTFDLTNKEKQRIWINPQVGNKEYHQEGDYYTFTIQDWDTTVLVGYYNGYKLTVTVDGQEKSSIEDFRNILFLFDNARTTDLTDLTDVCGGNNISLNLGEEYSFNAVDTDKTHVVAKLNGVELETRPEPRYRHFFMPGEDAYLLIYLNDNQHNKIKYDGGINEITGYDLIDHDIVNSAVQGETVTLYLKDPASIGYAGYNYSIDGFYIISEGPVRFIVNKIDTYTYQFTMPESYTEIYIWLNAPTYALTVSGDKSQYVDYCGNTEASQGDGISLCIIDDGNNLATYTFDKSAVGKTILAVNWTGIEASNVTYESAYESLNFTMPANAVNAEVNVYNPPQAPPQTPPQA